MTEHLKALAESADRNKELYQYNGPDANLLEWFHNPILLHGGEVEADPKWDEGIITIDISIPEFTCLCPKTGQPDFATIQINYVPNRRCVESKSLKLYLMAFRQFGTFHEGAVVRIGRDLVQFLDPVQLKVTGLFTPRGGIPFHPTFHYSKLAK